MKEILCKIGLLRTKHASIGQLKECDDPASPTSSRHDQSPKRPEPGSSIFSPFSSALSRTSSTAQTSLFASPLSHIAYFAMGYGTTPDDVVNNDEDLIPSPPSSGLFYLNQGVDDDRFDFSSPYYASSSSPRTTDPEVSAELDCYDSLETTAIVDVSYRKSRVTWRAANGEARQMFDLSLDLYANTATNTAIFKLYTYIIRKGRKGRSNKQAVYLFIHPENVRFITCEPSRTARRYKSKTNKPQTYYELRFSLTECPNIVVPRDRAFESKDKTRAQLDLLQELASTSDFVVHLNGAGITASKLDDLRLLGCMFSPTFTEHRPTTDFRRANLATLYAGSGGEIVGMNRGVVQSIEVDPPPYVGPAPDSCMVSSEYLCSDSEEGYDDDDDDDDEEEEEEDKTAFANHVLLLLDNLQTHFNAVERYFDGMERRLHGLENCVQQRRQEITFALAMANRHYNNMNNVNSNSNSHGNSSHSSNSTAQSPYPPYQTTVAQNTPATQRDEMVPQGA